jgi:hypothetical protein
MIKSLSFTFRERFLIFCIIIIFLPVCAFSQSRQLTGIIIDKDCNPIAGAIVYPKFKENLGTITDFEGKFSLSVPLNTEILVCNFGRILEYKLDTSNNIRIRYDEENIYEGFIFPTYNIYYSFDLGSNLLPYGTGLEFNGLKGRMGKEIFMSVSFNYRTDLSLNKLISFSYKFNNLTLREIHINFINTFDFYHLVKGQDKYRINNKSLCLEFYKNSYKGASIISGISYQTYFFENYSEHLGFEVGLGYRLKGNETRSKSLYLLSKYYEKDNYTLGLEYSNENYFKKRFQNFKIGLSYSEMKDFEDISLSLKIRIKQKYIMTI